MHIHEQESVETYLDRITNFSYSSDSLSRVSLFDEMKINSFCQLHGVNSVLISTAVLDLVTFVQYYGVFDMSHPVVFLSLCTYTYTY